MTTGAVISPGQTNRRDFLTKATLSLAAASQAGAQSRPTG